MTHMTRPARPALNAFRSLAIAVLALLTPAFAQAAPDSEPLHVRGTIVSSSSTAVVVSTSSGSDTIAFGPQTKLFGLGSSSLAKVTPGDFIGTTVAPGANGSLRALEVHIFPPALKGTGAGFYPWDKHQNSMTANATM